MAKTFTLKHITCLKPDEIIQSFTEKELLNSDFSDEYNNIARDHKIVQMLWMKIKTLEQRIKRLEEKK
jgi:hypothetical protein